MNDNRFVNEEMFVLSNFELRVVCERKIHFERAVRIAFGQHAKAVAFCKPEPNMMVLFWNEKGSYRKKLSGGAFEYTSDDAERLPYELDADGAVEFLWRWLQTVGKNELGDPPDLDGSVSPRAYRIEANGYVVGYEILRVTKVWSEYHK